MARPVNGKGRLSKIDSRFDINRFVTDISVVISPITSDASVPWRRVARSANNREDLSVPRATINRR